MVRYDIESRQEISNDVKAKILSGIKEIAGLADMLVISDYDKGVMTPSLIGSLLEIAREYNLKVLVDPKIINARHYTGVDYFKINLNNAQKVAGIDIFTNGCFSEEDSQKLCQVLAKILKCGNIFLTMGKYGLSVYSEGIFNHIPTGSKRCL